MSAYNDKKPNKLVESKKGLKLISSFFLATASTGLVKNMTSVYNCSVMNFDSYGNNQNYYFLLAGNGYIDTLLYIYAHVKS